MAVDRVEPLNERITVRDYPEPNHDSVTALHSETPKQRTLPPDLRVGCANLPILRARQNAFAYRRTSVEAQNRALLRSNQCADDAGILRIDFE